VLAGNYADYADSRLISPPILVPRTPDGHAWLQCFSWFSFAGGEIGTVEVSEDEGLTWSTLGATISGSSGDWLPLDRDLSPYVAKSVRVAFHLQGDCCGNSSGWYVDDIRIATANRDALTRGYWRYEAAFGDTVHDESGLENHGLLVNGAGLGTDVPWPSVPQFDNLLNTHSLLLAGDPQAFVVPDSPSLRPDQALTLEALINPSSGAWVIAGKQFGGCCANSYQLEMLGGVLNFNISDLGANHHVASMTAPSPGSGWHHVAGVWDGSEMRVYVDGVLGGTTPFAGSIGYDANPVIIGADDDGGGQPGCCYFVGSIDEVRLTAAALDPSAFLIGGATTDVDPPVAPPVVAAGPLALHAPRPNPMQARTTLSFTLPDERVVLLEVLEPSGRRVGTLAEGRYGPGTHQLDWAATDDGGRALPPGLYLVRLEAGRDVRVTKAFHIR